MKNLFASGVFFSMFCLLYVTYCVNVEARTCQSSGNKRGKNHPRECNHQNSSECCTEGHLHTTHKRSPSISGQKATLTINSFEKGGSGGGPSECDGKYHSDNDPVVALSTRWYNNGHRCFKFINIQGNGHVARAMVVDECDSSRGCRNDIVDGSKAVWEALGVAEKDRGEMTVYWSDA